MSIFSTSTKEKINRWKAPSLPFWILLFFLVPGNIDLSVLTNSAGMKEEMGINYNGIRLILFCFLSCIVFFRHPRIPKALGVYVFFLIFSVFTLFYTLDPLEGLRFFSKLLVPFLVYVLASRLPVSSFEKLNKYFFIILLVHFPFMIGTFSQWSHSSVQAQDIIRASGLSGGRVCFGTFMLLMFLLFSFHNPLPLNKRRSRFVVLIIPLLGVLLSGARIAWAGLFLILLGSKLGRNPKYFLLVVAIVISMLFFFKPLILNRLGVQIQDGKIELAGAGGGTARDRLDVWKWLLEEKIPPRYAYGYGLGSSQTILKKLPPVLVGAFDYPHNEYLRIVLETGIIGLSLFVGAWVYMGWYFYATYQKWIFVLPIAIFAVFCFADNTLNNYFENGGVLAYILAYLSKLEDSRKNRDV